MLESARATLRTSLAAGQASLAEEDFVAARNQFAAAVDAVDTLGTNDSQSRLVRQLHQETVALTNLAPTSLFGMLEEAALPRDAPGNLSWETLFDARYSGTWLVLQAPIRRDATGFIVDIPVVVGAEQQEAVVRADLPGFEYLTFEDNIATAVFAAPLSGCELDEAGDVWVVTLDGPSGFLWATAENLRPLGFLDSEWISEDEIAARLEAQSDLPERTR